LQGCNNITDVELLEIGTVLLAMLTGGYSFVVATGVKSSYSDKPVLLSIQTVYNIQTVAFSICFLHGGQLMLIICLLVLQA
jgi:3-keto-L-gulonate-6-phosphate decarboxylase